MNSEWILEESADRDEMADHRRPKILIGRNPQAWLSSLPFSRADLAAIPHSFWVEGPGC
jgi:hypothetical protein